MNPFQQTDALDRLLDPLARGLSPEAARVVADLRAPADVQARIDELAAKSNEGELTPHEKAEYDAYVEAIDLISILQLKARAAMDRAGVP